MSLSETPLASLSLTHVHYVSSHDWPDSNAIANAIDAPLEPRRHRLVCFCLAGPRTTSIMHHLRFSDLGLPRGGNYPDVRWSNGL